jgi:hypothetical protein
VKVLTNIAPAPTNVAWLPTLRVSLSFAPFTWSLPISGTCSLGNLKMLQQADERQRTTTHR